MLSRTADSLYWMARYVERAENLARILSVTERMAMTPASDGHGMERRHGEGSEWHSAVVISGCEKGFYKKHDEANAHTVVAFLGLDRENPSSIRTCLDTARRNAREVRTAITSDMWEALNSTWLETEAASETDITGGSRQRFMDWVKERSQLFNGAVVSTMLRNDGFSYNRMGAFLERSDNTARILDVKYHILLPDNMPVGGGLDYYQWASILRAASAYANYHHIYKGAYKPLRIAELLILREEMPRSLSFCLKNISDHLDILSGQYGSRTESHRLVGQYHSSLRYSNIDEIFRQGLHEFLTEFIARNYRLSDQIVRDYLIG